jgi:hypothetical protein
MYNGIFFAIFLFSCASAIDWTSGNWAFGCDFVNNDLAYVNGRGEDCSGSCSLYPHCTHYTWNRGTCYLKSGFVSRGNAIPISDHSVVCGIII